MGDLGAVVVFLLLVGLVPFVGVVLRFVSVLRLPARKISDVCCWEGVWFGFCVL